MESEKSQDLLNVFKITVQGFFDLLESGIDLSCLYLLEKFNENIDLTNHNTSTKVAAWKLTLLRKGYIDNKGKITELGKNLLEVVLKGEPVEVSYVNTVKKLDDEFELWWSNFPPNDLFTYKGMKFQGSRALRVSKTECKRKFLQIIAEGDYTAERLIKALQYEVESKKEVSIKEKENKMKYMINSLSYLNQRRYEAFIDAIIEDKPISSSGAVDI